MTVDQLIKKLKLYPKHSFIGWRGPTNHEDEIDGIVKFVEDFSPDEAFDPEYCKNIFVVLS